MVYKSNGNELDFNNPKPSQISINTLFLEKEKGGCNLIDFQCKMKAFRINLIFKYLKSQNNNWTETMNYKP